MKRRPPPSTAEVVALVQTVYRDLAQRPIDRDCIRRTECCHFRLTGRTPFLTKGEAITAAVAMKKSGRKKLPPSPDGACPLLDSATGRCVIYEGRPFGCRTHFCAAAGGPYARREVADLIHRLEDLDSTLGGDGGRALPTAIEGVLRQL